MSSPSNDLRLVVDADATVLPGDMLATVPRAEASGDNATQSAIRLGVGVRHSQARLTATKAGVARVDARRRKVWVCGQQRRYDAAVDDAVVGVVLDRHAEEYRVDVNGTDTVVLGAQAFEGATKRNKPALGVGAVVYCRVTRASRLMEGEVSCVEPGSSKSWVSGETLYGELRGGNVVVVSLSLARALQSEDAAVLRTLGAAVPFAAAVGCNGRVWVKAGSVRETVLVCLLIGKADELGFAEWAKHAASVLRQFKA